MMLNYKQRPLKPTLSRNSWRAILFTLGITTGLVFSQGVIRNYFSTSAQAKEQSSMSAPSALPYHNQVTSSRQGNYLLVQSNGIPNHAIGGGSQHNSTYTMAEQHYQFQVPTAPRMSLALLPREGYVFGVALNGVPFSAGTDRYWQNNPASGWRYADQATTIGRDSAYAQIQANGAYTYDGVPRGLVAKLTNGKRMVLVGYAADGFPIYSQYGYAQALDPTSDVRLLRSSYQLKPGLRSGQGSPGGQYDGTFVQDYYYAAGSGDLDECNGRTGPTPDYPQGIYHYYVTDAFPFIPRCFRGTPDPSFQTPPSPAVAQQALPPRALPNSSVTTVAQSGIPLH